MLRSLILTAYLVASLSASDATPGDTLRLTAGCDSGAVSIEPQQGLSYNATRGTGLAQSVDLTVASDARPGLRYVRVVCGRAEAELHLTVRDAGFEVFVPMATQRPAG